MTRTLLPVKADMLRPKEHDVIMKNQQLRNLRKEWYYYYKRAKDLPVLHEGQRVRTRPMILGEDKWRSAIVTRRCDERSYEVESSGNYYRRNRQDLKVSNEADDTPQSRECESSKSMDNPELPPVVTPDSTEEKVQESKKTTDIDDTVRRSSRQRRPPLRFKDYVSP